MKVIVIGGGPAGMMAAIIASRNGNEVMLFEKMRSVGRKLSITGKGRCNITNATEMSEMMNQIPGNPKFLYHAFHVFSNQAVIQFFHSIGVKTKVERGERVFPESDQAMEVVDKLKKEMERSQVKVIVNCPIREIVVENQIVKGVMADQFYAAEKVILATGGLSYPSTGSTGDGYKIVEKLGHTITPLKGSLIPMETYESKELQGLSLKNVRISIYNEAKEVYTDFGEMLFTHFGVSGPIILSASAHLLRVKDVETKMKQQKIRLKIDLKPALTEEKLEQRLQRDFEKNTKKQFKNCFGDLLPAKLIPYIVALSGVDAQKQINQISKAERKKVLSLLKNLTFTIKKFRPIEEAIVTSGGISVKEINAKTMESKLVKGLYFAGEIIDVDAYTGGFNLQIAWSTGYVAGQNEKP